MNRPPYQPRIHDSDWGLTSARLLRKPTPSGQPHRPEPRHQDSDRGNSALLRDSAPDRDVTDLGQVGRNRHPRDSAAVRLRRDQGQKPRRFNQIANYAVTQTEINIAIGDKPPSVYFDEVKNQCNGGAKKYGGITSMDDFKENLAQHCIPEGILGPLADDFDAFLAERRELMAAKIKSYFNVL